MTLPLSRSRGEHLLPFAGDDAFVFGVAFSPDGTRLATATGSRDPAQAADNGAKVWDARTGKLLLTLSGHGREVFDVAFSPDGKRLVTASVDTTAKLWDAGTGKELRTLSGRHCQLEL